MAPEKSKDSESSKLPTLELEEVKKMGIKFVIYKDRVLDVGKFNHPGSNKLIDENLERDIA